MGECLYWLSASMDLITRARTDGGNSLDSLNSCQYNGQSGTGFWSWSTVIWGVRCEVCRALYYFRGVSCKLCLTASLAASLYRPAPGPQHVTWLSSAMDYKLLPLHCQVWKDAEIVSSRLELFSLDTKHVEMTSLIISCQPMRIATQVLSGLENLDLPNNDALSGTNQLFLTFWVD